MNSPFQTSLIKEFPFQWELIPYDTHMKYHMIPNPLMVYRSHICKYTSTMAPWIINGSGASTNELFGGSSHASPIFLSTSSKTPGSPWVSLSHTYIYIYTNRYNIYIYICMYVISKLYIYISGLELRLFTSFTEWNDPPSRYTSVAPCWNRLTVGSLSLDPPKSRRAAKSVGSKAHFGCTHPGRRSNVPDVIYVTYIYIYVYDCIYV